MSYFLIIVVASIFIWIFIRKRRKGVLPEYHISICIPFKGTPVLDAEAIVQKFKRMWKTEIACGLAESLGSSQKGEKTYLLGNGNHNLKVTIAEHPLPEDLMTVVTTEGFGIAAEDSEALANHQGYIAMDYLMGPGEAVTRVEFTARALLVLASLNGSLGFLNLSAMLFRSRSAVETYLDHTELRPEDLHFLFANVHCVREDDLIWMHTHGLEQFGVPDLEIRYQDVENETYYLQVISNGSIYMIENGPVLQPGNTAELVGDGIIFQIKTAKHVADHPFGQMGCLEISRIAGHTP